MTKAPPVVEVEVGTSRPKGSGVRAALRLLRYLVSDIVGCRGGRSIHTVCSGSGKGLPPRVALFRQKLFLWGEGVPRFQARLGSIGHPDGCPCPTLSMTSAARSGSGVHPQIPVVGGFYPGTSATIG